MIKSATSSVTMDILPSVNTTKNCIKCYLLSTECNLLEAQIHMLQKTIQALEGMIMSSCTVPEPNQERVNHEQIDTGVQSDSISYSDISEGNCQDVIYDGEFELPSSSFAEKP